MAAQTESTVRAAALRSMCLSLAKTCSIGFKSGEYFGRKNNLAPAERMSWRTALLLWLPRLSDHDIAWTKRRQENLLDIDPEAHAIDWSFDEPWRIDPVMAQGREESHGLPAAVGDLSGKFAPRRAHPRRGAMSVRVQVSSMKTSRSASTQPWYFVH